MKFKITLRFSFLATLIPLATHAQVVISAGTALGMSNTPDVIIQATGNINNGSTVDFSAANLFIDLAGGDQQIFGNWTVNGLRLSSAGNKTLTGSLTVTQALQFQAGFLIPQAGKILYTGSTDNLEVVDGSYVKGIFFQAGTGDRKFPVGTSSAFAPLRFSDIQIGDEIGVEAFDADPGLIPDVGLLSVSNNRYWLITMTDLTQIGTINSPVSLSLNGVVIPPDNAPAVVQAADLNTQAVSLGNFSNDPDFVTSKDPVTAPLLTIGITTEIVVRVRDLITPFGSAGVNDKLYIENIERFDFNRVTLLDRWGVPVKKWEHYTNDVEYDFGKLSPGNYICVVEYGDDVEGNNTQKITQMVTVLKTN
jgi:hypothetical protein